MLLNLGCMHLLESKSGIHGDTACSNHPLSDIYYFSPEPALSQDDGSVVKANAFSKAVTR